jgi:subfamily B ATP-binding cassette protein MsbA
LLPFVKPARWHFLAGLVAGLIYAVSTGAGLPVMGKFVLPVIFDQEAEPKEISPQVLAIAEFFHLDGVVKNFSLAALARAFFGEDYRDKLLLTACLALPLIFLIRGIAAFLNRYLLNKVGFIALENVRVAAFKRLLELPLAFYHQHQSGDLMARLLNDTEQLRQVVVKTSGEIIKQPFTLLTALGYLVFLSVTERSVMFTLVAMLSAPLCVLLIRLATRRLRKRSAQLAQATGELTATVSETLQSPLEVQAYNLQPQQTARFADRVRNILRLGLKTVFYQAITSPAIEVVSAFGFVGALYFSVRTGMDFATFSSLGIALYLCYEPIKQLSNLYGHFKIGAASLDRIEHILDAEDTVPPPASPKPPPAASAALEFQHVTFRYVSRAQDAPAALTDVNLKIEPGEVVALVGHTGAGKTTFAMLIPRFYDPTAGRVVCGGVDLRELDKTAWRERIAVVPQMPALFNATIAENIRVGRLNATDAEVRAAAQQAFVADFIASLPQGYDTMVGERGAALSGGQRQRIAIARAFLKDAPILILDEAMSALDSETEAMIHTALEKLVQGRTTLMIAHRFSSISLATRVLVFEEGRITGDGSPAALAETHPVYRRMSELQQLG